MADQRGRPSDEELSQTYNEAIVKGIQLFHELESSRIRPSDDRLLNDLYYIDTGYVNVADEIQEDLANWNVDTTSVSFVDIYSSRTRRDNAAYMYHISARTGLLLVSEAFRQRDTHPAARQLRPSETAWQSFLRIASLDGVGPSKLRCIVLSFVLNENTKAVIFEGGRRSTSTFQKTLGYKEYTDLDDGFYALLGSALGKMMVNMLLDHKAEIGYRSVDRVVLLSKEGLVSDNQWGPTRSFLIVLSEPRERKRAASEPPRSPERSIKRRRMSVS